MIGRIEVRRRQERSYNGIPIAVLKSGIQKYARRGMLEKGLWCLAEIDLFSLLETEPEAVAEYLRRSARSVPAYQQAEDERPVIRKARAIRTNLINRLIVMVSEEISISAYWMPLVVNRLYELWRAERDQAASRKHLIDIYRYLAAAEKIRLISDLKSVYLLPPDYVEPDQRPDLQVVHAEMIRSLGLSHRFEGCETVPEGLLDSCALDLSPFLDENDERLKRIINGILYHLKYRSDHVFYWVNELIDRQRDARGEPRLSGRKNPLNAVWQLLLGLADMKEGLWNDPPRDYPPCFSQLRDIISVLKEWYDTMTHRERPIYLYHAILLIVRRDQIDWELPIPAIDTSWEEVEALYRANLSGKIIELDDFILDIHTGKQDEHALTRFAREGAFVARENPRLRDEDYRRIYHGLKERLDVYRRSGLRGVGEAFGGKG